MILAAGRGTRMRPLTDETPKPMLLAGGKALIVHMLEALVRHGFDEVVINHAWLGEQIVAALGDGSRYGARVQYCAEPEGALETGGGVLAALPLLDPAREDAPFVLVSGDVWTDFPLSRLRTVALDEAHLVLVPNPAFKRTGDFRLEPAGVPARARRDGDQQAWLTYASIAALRPSLLHGHPPGRFPLAPLLFDAAERGTLSGERYDGAWFNVGSPEELEALERSGHVAAPGR